MDLPRQAPAAAASTRGRQDACIPSALALAQIDAAARKGHKLSDIQRAPKAKYIFVLATTLVRVAMIRLIISCLV